MLSNFFWLHEICGHKFWYLFPFGAINAWNYQILSDLCNPDNFSEATTQNSKMLTQPHFSNEILCVSNLKYLFYHAIFVSIEKCQLYASLQAPKNRFLARNHLFVVVLCFFIFIMMPCKVSGFLFDRERMLKRLIEIHNRTKNLFMNLKNCLS